MICGMELMRLLAREAKVTELETYRMRSGDILVLSEIGDGNKWIVAMYSKADIEQWSISMYSLDAAQSEFDRLKSEDKAIDTKSGAKR